MTAADVWAMPVLWP